MKEVTSKDKLLASALRLFSENGFEATSTTSICTDAGFSSGALFVHFKTKNEMLDILYLSIKKEYFGEANTGLEGVDDIFEIAGKSLFQGACYYTNNPEKFSFMKRFLHSPHISRIAQSEIEKEMKHMNILLDAGKSQGKVIDLDNTLISQMVVGALYNLIEYVIQENKKISRNHIDIILNMVRK